MPHQRKATFLDWCTQGLARQNDPFQQKFHMELRAQWKADLVNLRTTQVDSTCAVLIEPPGLACKGQNPSMCLHPDLSFLKVCPNPQNIQGLSDSTTQNGHEEAVQGQDISICAFPPERLWHCFNQTQSTAAWQEANRF